jgi:hypothetical protein
MGRLVFSARGGLGFGAVVHWPLGSAGDRELLDP